MYIDGDTAVHKGCRIATPPVDYPCRKVKTPERGPRKKGGRGSQPQVPSRSHTAGMCLACFEQRTWNCGG